MNTTGNVTTPIVADSSNSNFNPSMAIIIVVLISALVLVGFFSIYIRRCTQGNRETSQILPGRSTATEPPEFHERPGEGLDKEIVDTLPVVSYSVVKNLSEGKEQGRDECAVCLERFEEDEQLRLLPKCSHVFHSECIDVWFHSHSTCPLCRASLLPTFSEISAGVPAVGDVSRRILEAQEEVFGSSRHGPADDESDAAQQQESPTELDESSSDLGRNNGSLAHDARRALSRNSNSFRQAARGVEVRERLAAVSARYPPASSSSDLDRAPQRASSLNCVNFSLPRAGSLTASGRREFYNIDIFPFGSERYGASGGVAPQCNSPGRDNKNEQKEPAQRVADLGRKNSESALLTEEGSCSAENSERWITIDLYPKSEAGNDASTAPDANLNSRNVFTITSNMLQQPLPESKHRSGPLPGKPLIVAANDKELQRIKAEKGGSFSALRGSFLLHRSASEGRSHVFTSSGHHQTEVVTATNADVVGSSVDATLPSQDQQRGGSTTSFARRTLQWLAGGNRSSSTRPSSGTDLQPDQLQEIVSTQ